MKPVLFGKRLKLNSVGHFIMS